MESTVPRGCKCWPSLWASFLRDSGVPSPLARERRLCSDPSPTLVEKWGPLGIVREHSTGRPLCALLSPRPPLLFPLRGSLPPPLPTQGPPWVVPNPGVQKHASSAWGMKSSLCPGLGVAILLFGSHLWPNKNILEVPRVCVSGLIVQPQETRVMGKEWQSRVVAHFLWPLQGHGRNF